MGLVPILRRAAPLVALAAAGAVLARRQARAGASEGARSEPPFTPSPVPPPSEPEPAPVVAADAEIVPSVYDAPPVEDPVEEDLEDPLEEDAPVDRPEPATVTDVVDDLLAPLPSEEEIEDATVVDDEPGAGDRPPGDSAR